MGRLEDFLKRSRRPEPEPEPEAPAPKPLPSEGPPVEPLWPDGAPGALGRRDADIPALTVYLPPPEIACGTAVVVCPGGDYWDLHGAPEGRDVAEWLNSLGVAAFVLKYRLAPSYHHPTQLQDGRRAIRLVRHRAAEWHLHPDCVGILGFSAGGHLAASVGTHFTDGNPEADDAVNRLSSRPDFMVLVYPVISFNTKYAHAPSRDNLLGDDSKKEKELYSLSNEKQATTGTPPTFLVHTGDDKEVVPENSVLLYVSLRRVGVPAEMHIYEKGGHGFGLAPNDPILASWTERCADWMRRRGLLPHSPASSLSASLDPSEG